MALMIAAFLWVVERISLVVPGTTSQLPSFFVFLILNGSVLYIGSYVIYCLIRYRKQDAFSDNFFFLLALPLFLTSKNLLLSPDHYVAGWTMSLGIFRLAFAVMFERTITQFMKNSAAVELPRKAWLDYSIKGLILASVFQSFWPGAIASGIFALAGVLLLVRFFMWSPRKGFEKFEIGIMYVGYLGLVLHLILEAFRISELLGGVGSLSTHVFTFLCMGVVIPGMMIRICQGHTGRKLLFTRSDRMAIGSMIVAAFFRLVLTQVFPAQYSVWIALSGLGWLACFSFLAWRLAPFLWQARVDGKVH